MHPLLLLKVISPSKVILEQPDVAAFACRMQGSGALEIMPGHLPLIGATQAGTVEYLVGEEVHELTVAEGILQVSQNTIHLMVIETGLTQAAMVGPVHGRLEASLFQSLKEPAEK